MTILFTIAIFISLILAFKNGLKAQKFFIEFHEALTQFRNGTGRLDIVSKTEELYYMYLTYCLFFIALAVFFLIIILNPLAV